MTIEIISTIGGGVKFGFASQCAVAHFGLATTSGRRKLASHPSGVRISPTIQEYYKARLMAGLVVSAEGERFELSIPLRVCRLSKAVH